MCFWWKRKQSCWEEVIKALQSKTISLEQKKEVVYGIVPALAEISDEERDSAYEQLIQTLDKLVNDLFVEYAWERGLKKTDTWINPEAKVLYDSCIAVTHTLKSAWSEIRLVDLQD